MNRLFVLGNVAIDVSLRVPHLPSPGETLIATDLARAPGGKGLNQAVMAARAGASVRFCAAIGLEPEAGLLRAALAAENLDAVRLTSVALPCDISALVVAVDAENVIVSTGACAMALPTASGAAFLSEIAAGDLLLMQGGLARETTLKAALLARACGARVLLNAAPLRWDYAELLGLADILIANRVEAAELAGSAEPEAAARALRAAGAGAVIVTLGDEGCLLAEGAELHRLPTPPALRCDTSGAGDVFCGVLAAVLARELAPDLSAAVAMAQRAAALSVTRPGCFASFPSSEELLPVLGIA